MSSEVESVSAVDLTTAVSGLLDAVQLGVGSLTDRQQLDLIADLLRVQSRLSGVLHTIVGEVDRNEAAQTAYGVPTASWLAAELRYTRSQACAMVHHAKDLDRFGSVGDALRDGRANQFQARAVTDVLRKLPDDLPADAQEQAQETMVGFCDEFDSQHLKGLAHHLLELVAPEVADEVEAARMERERRAALRNRHLS